jgi:hypothetical protein
MQGFLHFFHSDDMPLIKVVLYCPQVPPYEPRIFPLPDDVYEKMLKAMPEGHPFPPYSMAPKKLFTKDNEMVTCCFWFLIHM